jgi:hypothetical protein
MPWEVEDIRNIVRGAGLITLAFSAGLWCVQEIESNYHPTARPAPIYRTSADDRAAWVAAHTDPKSRQFSSAPKLAPKHAQQTQPLKSVPVQTAAPLSTVKLEAVFPLFHQFTVYLFKEDGWLDTHIPVTAGTEVHIWDPVIGHNTQWIKCMIGKSVFYPAKPYANEFDEIVVRAILPEDNPGDAPSSTSWQFVRIAQGDVESIKLKVFPDYGTNGLRYEVKLDQIRVQPDKYTLSKQREQAALAEWDRK